MSATPSNSTPAGDDRNLVAVDATTAVNFEDRVHIFWKKNRTAVLGLCALIVVALVAREGWDYMARQKELEVAKAYAAATTPEQLKSFSDAHSNHALGGIAQLRMADDAYKAGKSAEAVTNYDKAIAALKDGPLKARAQIGRALAKVQAGKTSEASAELKKLVEDAGMLKAVRSEAAYHLSSMAAESGNVVETQKYVDELMRIDATSPWTQRAMALRASMPTTPEPAAASTPEGQKKDETPTQGVKLKIPGK